MFRDAEGDQSQARDLDDPRGRGDVSKMPQIIARPEGRLKGPDVIDPNAHVAALEARDAEIARLRDELLTWKSRALAMFFRLPDDVTIGDLRDEAAIAKMHVTDR